MTHDQIATFWTAMVWNVLKIQYARLKEHVKQQVKRYFDRYYRIGRHEPRTVGLANLHWASTLTQQLRDERRVIHHV